MKQQKKSQKYDCINIQTKIETGREGEGVMTATVKSLKFTHTHTHMETLGTMETGRGHDQFGF